MSESVARLFRKILTVYCLDLEVQKYKSLLKNVHVIDQKIRSGGKMLCRPPPPPC